MSQPSLNHKENVPPLLAVLHPDSKFRSQPLSAHSTGFASLASELRMEDYMQAASPTDRGLEAVNTTLKEHRDEINFMKQQLESVLTRCEIWD